MRVGNRLLLATALVTLVGGSGGLAAEGALRPECLSFVLRELQPGQRFQDVRKRLGAKWDSIRTAPSDQGTEASVTYLNSPQSTTVVFDRNPTNESTAKVIAVQHCTATPADTATSPLSGLEARWGAPIAGREFLPENLRDGSAVWQNANCGLELVAYRRPPEWWEQTDQALCVELHALRATPKVASTIDVAAPTASDVPAADAPVVVTTLPESSEQSAAETNSDAPMVPPRPTATPARLVVRVSPVYPETGRRSNAPARVVVEVTVTTQGATEKASIIESTAPDEGFEQSALAAIEKWRYEPATQNGQPVEQRIRIVINFR